MGKLFKSKLKHVAVCLLVSCVFVLQAAAQDQTFPDELVGYQFYGKGKLANIRLAESTKEDVQRVFGKSCSAMEPPCTFADDWNVIFWYLDEVTIDNEKYSPRPQFAGRLEMIYLEPKQRLSFRKVTFPKAFERSSAAGCGGSVHNPSETCTFYDIYWRESRGLELEYRLFLKTNRRDNPDSKLKKGDLAAIVYRISDDKLDEMREKQKEGNLE